MDRLVILMLGEGSFAQGFPVTLQIGYEARFRFAQMTGKLPPDPELARLYQQWQAVYRKLGMRLRLSAPDDAIKHVSAKQDCQQAAQQLRDRFNHWLQAESFRAIREKWLEQLQPSETIRIILQTQDSLVPKLPWHLWDLIERYPHTEIALSAPVYEQASPIATPVGRVGILAILGNSEGIDTHTDRVRLEQLPDVQLRLLVQPSRQEVSDRLWEQPWDILFFAGHSSSQDNGETGRIYINQTESLTISQLRYALKKSLERGLKLAIFNSCDGLGLARELADLHIPQVIVMREPVPDQVAQAFLKYFLHAYAHGESLYQSVRQARERLQALEDQFPCATWLPVIYQNPAEMPPTWTKLKGVRSQESKGRSPESGVRSPESVDSPPSPHPSISPSPHSPRSLLPAIAASLAVTILLATVRYFGILQPLELKAYDHLVRLRPAEWTDSRLLVITLDDADIKAQERGRGSLSDGAFQQLLTKLDQYKPRAIGLDIYRDYGVEPQRRALAQRLKTDPRLVMICKVSDPEHNVEGISPPPEVGSDRQGFSDFLEDPDDVLRRQLLFMDVPASSPCATPYAFSVQLAFRYLAAEGIEPTFTDDGNLQLGKTVFARIQSHWGGYQNLQAWGNQILLNYRANAKSIEQISLQQVLKGDINPDAVKDRIILIGVVARSFGDYWSTPYGEGPTEKLPGVIVQAQMTSQMISAVLNQRPLIWVWSPGLELLWLGMWSATGGVISWWFLRSKPTPRSWLWVFLAIVTTSGMLYVISYGIFTFGGWVPLIPPAIAILLTTGVVGIYQTFKAS